MRKVALVLVVFLVGCLPSQNKEEEVVTTLNGTAVALQDITNGAPAIINFWASWCSFCKEEMPLLQAVHKDHSGVTVIGINLQEERKVARAYTEAGGYTFENLLDPSSELKKQFGVFTQPTTFVWDAEGSELHRKDGPFTEEELAEWIEELSPSVPLEPLEQVTEVIEFPGAKIQTSPTVHILSSWYGEEVQHTIPLDEIFSGGPPKDGIPSLDSPQFMDPADVPEDWNDFQGILLSIGEDTRFYPFNILNWHEIVNDTVGGVPVSVTYCPLCASAVVYDRTTSQGLDTLGVSGFLYQSNLLMYDRATDSLWDQAKGESVVGSLTGEKLNRRASDIVSVAIVREEWPNARVLSTVTGYVRQYNLNPYGGYDQIDSTYFPVGTVDDRARSKELVYGVVVDGMAKAYTLDAIRSEQRIQDEFGGVKVLIQFDPKTEKIRFLRFTSTDETEEIVPLYGFWFAWVAQYPQTALYH